MATEITLQLTDDQEAWLFTKKPMGLYQGDMGIGILRAAAHALPEPLYRVELVGSLQQLHQARIRLGDAPGLLLLAGQLAQILSESPAEQEARRVH